MRIDSRRCGEIAVAGIDNDVKLGIRQLEAGGERNGAAVRSVERIELDVAGHAAGCSRCRRPRASDPRFEFRVDEGACEGVDGGADAASGAQYAAYVGAEDLIDGLTPAVNNTVIKLSDICWPPRLLCGMSSGR